MNSAAIKGKQAADRGREKQTSIVLISFIVNKCVQYCASIGRIAQYVQYVQYEQYMNITVQHAEQ